jgi:leucyl/phenylalanyl-tRNA--protein transferase
MDEITSETLLSAYANGYFPMAKNQDDDELFWFYPDMRGIIPLDQFHIPRSLKKFIKTNPYQITVNQAFGEVIEHCAGMRSVGRETSWINDRIIALYSELHAIGYAYSIETWSDNNLVGGLYGVSIGGVFFGESMFSLANNASKVALVHLVERLNEAGYQLLDTQYVNDHLKQFGIIEITRDDYLEKLQYALKVSPNPSSRFATVSPSIS